jgi:hypothetical protein
VCCVVCCGGRVRSCESSYTSREKKGIKIRPEKVWWGSPKATENQTISVDLT